MANEASPYHRVVALLPSAALGEVWANRSSGEWRGIDYRGRWLTLLLVALSAVCARANIFPMQMENNLDSRFLC